MLQQTSRAATFDGILRYC